MNLFHMVSPLPFTLTENFLNELYTSRNSLERAPVPLFANRKLFVYILSTQCFEKTFVALFNNCNTIFLTLPSLYVCIDERYFIRFHISRYEIGQNEKSLDIRLVKTDNCKSGTAENSINL